MKFFQKRWVAWTLCVLVIFASTLLNTRWKLGAKCRDLTGSFYEETGIGPALTQLAEEGESLAALAQSNGIDAGALRSAAANLKAAMGDPAGQLYGYYNQLRSELENTEQKLLSSGLSAEDAAQVSSCLNRVHTALAQINTSDYNARVESFRYRYNNGFTRMLAGIAGVHLPETFA